jgi:TrmH family RNA methyltransferase
MANFDVSHLTVVDPYEPHWREAKSAVGADQVLQNARCTECLTDAIADCSLVIGTGTLAHRKPEQTIVSLPSLQPIVQQRFAHGGRVALVFGPEKRGLTRDDLALCHLLVEIPTHPSQPSMNLGQAVAVCLYELAASRDHSARSAASSNSPESNPSAAYATTIPDPAATARDLDLLAAVIDETMITANYSPSIMRNANRHDLHLLLRRLALSRGDARRILGLFRRILWQLRRRSASR